MTAPHPPELTIPVHDLDAGGKEVRLALEKSWLKRALEGTDITPGKGGELDVRLSKSGTDVVIHGELRGELVIACARCLEPARITIREPIAALAVPASALREPGQSGHGEDGELETDEADVIPYDGDTLVLDDLVRDELVLGVPMIPLCSEGCPGIRPSPGPGGGAHDGAPIDPRLAPLLALKKS
jgi:uncharacterized protein